MSVRKLKKSPSGQVKGKKADQYDFEMRNIEGQSSNIDATTCSTMLGTFSKLSKSKEKELLRKFGIVHSTSTSEREGRLKASKPFIIREIENISKKFSKNVKKAFKFTSIRIPNKKRLFLSAAERKNSRHLKTFRTDTYDDDSESTLLTLSDDLLDSFTEDEPTLEHDSIATKYGLPHEVIQCACYMRDEIFGIEKNPKNSKPICISRSCYDFQKKYGKNCQEFRHGKHGKTIENLDRARDTFENLQIKARDIMDENLFLDAMAFLKNNYPYYWKYVSRKEELYKDGYDRTKEKFSKTRVVLSCMRLLKEQELLSKHYRVEMRGLDAGVQFNERLNHNFTIACSFLLKEYPSFFVYMMKKYSFNDLVCKKLEIIRNRLRLIKRARLPEYKLKKLNDLHKKEQKRH